MLRRSRASVGMTSQLLDCEGASRKRGEGGRETEKYQTHQARFLRTLFCRKLWHSWQEKVSVFSRPCSCLPVARLGHRPRRSRSMISEGR